MKLQTTGRRTTRSFALGVCILSSLSFASAASATPLGGVLSGPTRHTGASVYWNPAAAARVDQDWSAALTGSFSYLRPSFTRAGNDPNTGEPFAKVTFGAPAPDAAITVSGRTSVKGLRWLIGTFSPNVIGATWPQEGPQRYYSQFSYYVTYGGVAGALWHPTDSFAIGAGAGPYYATLRLENSIDFGAFANSVTGTNLFPLESPLLEGDSMIKGSGWSAMGVVGVWYQPKPWWRLGAGLVVPRDMPLQGTMVIDSSEILQQALPGFELRPRGKVDLVYPMPQHYNVSTELRFGRWSSAVVFQYMTKSRQSVILAQVTEAEPDLVAGRQVSVKGVHDDWLLGARLTHRFETWELGLRLDIDPRYVPDETVNPINLDFSTVHGSLGADFQLGLRWTMSVSYSFIYLVPYTVKNSIFNASAPRESGLAVPPANGHYSGQAHMIAFGVSWTSVDG